MKRILLAALVALAAFTVTLAQGNGNKNSGQGKSSDEQTIISLERQAWEAWKNKNGAFFQSYLTDDAVLVGSTGVEGKASVVKGIASSPCEVKSYELDNFKFVMFNKNTAFLTYRARQDFTCNGKAGPPIVWASSLFIKRNGKWLNVTHQESVPEPGM